MCWLERAIRSGFLPRERRMHEPDRDRELPSPPRTRGRFDPSARPRYLPALALVGALIGLQNLAIRSDSTPDPFQRPALSVTQAFRVPPETRLVRIASSLLASGGAEDPEQPPPLHDLSNEESEDGDLEARSPGDDPDGPEVDDISSVILGQSEVDSPMEPTSGEILQPEAFPALPGSVVPSEVTDAKAGPGATPASHVVAPGETLWSLARSFGLTVDAIRAANPTLGASLRAGEQLQLPIRGASAGALGTEGSVPIRTAPSPGIVQAQGANSRDYTIQVGDTLTSISRRFGIAPVALALANGIDDPNSLRPGNTLRIEAPDSLPHTVRPGDSLWSVAQLYDLTVAELLAFNRLDSGSLRAEQILRIPTAGMDASQLEILFERRRQGDKPFSLPLSGRMTDHFGMRVHPIHGRKIPHRGLDIAAQTGSKIRSAREGQVTFAGWLEGYGKVIEIRHASGYTTRYAHCSKLLVKRGQRVQKGETIAMVGATGLATAPHLHFELRKNGVPMDPLKHI